MAGHAHTTAAATAFRDFPVISRDLEDHSVATLLSVREKALKGSIF